MHLANTFRARVTVAMLGIGLACAPADESRTAEELPAQSNPPAQPDTIPLDSLLAELRSLTGTFHSPLPALASFDGDATVFRALQPVQPTLERLVECMGTTDASNVSHDGKRLTVGMVCYAALANLIYYEDTNEAGEAGARWTGHIDLTASPRQQRAAQSAWHDVVARRVYDTQ